MIGDLPGDPDPSGLSVVIDRAETPPDEETRAGWAIRSPPPSRAETGYGEIVLTGENGHRERFIFAGSRRTVSSSNIRPNRLSGVDDPDRQPVPDAKADGKVAGIDEDLVVPDKTKSISPGRHRLLAGRNDEMVEKNSSFCMPRSSIFRSTVPSTSSHGSSGTCSRKGNRALSRAGRVLQVSRKGNAYKIQYRVMLSRYTGKTVCPDCEGGRLRQKKRCT